MRPLDQKKKKKIWKTLFILCTIAIVYLSLSPADDIPNLKWNIPNLDKYVHFCMYLGFSMLLTPLLKTYRHYYLLVVILSIIMGGTMEIFQIVMEWGRNGSWADMAANSLGAIIGPWIFTSIVKYKPINLLYN